MISTTKANVETFKHLYEHGYGNKYPDEYIISFYYNWIKKCIDMKKKERLILDYGCGIGTNLAFFNNLPEEKWNCYGCDTDKSACDLANARLKSETILHIEPESQNDLATLFFTKYGKISFDVILACNVLFYLSDNEILNLLNEFDKLLNKNGIVLFTMHDVNNFRYLKSRPSDIPGLRYVDMSQVAPSLERAMVYINFKTSLECDELFSSVFHKLFLGYRDACYKDEHIGGVKLHIYFGRKMCPF